MSGDEGFNLDKLTKNYDDIFKKFGKRRKEKKYPTETQVDKAREIYFEKIKYSENLVQNSNCFF